MSDNEDKESLPPPKSTAEKSIFADAFPIWVQVVRWCIIVLNATLAVIFSLIALKSLFQVQMYVFIYNSLLAISSVPAIYGAYKQLIIYLAIHILFLFVKVVYIFNVGYKYESDDKTDTRLTFLDYVLLIIFIVEIVATFAFLYQLNQTSKAQD